MEVESKQKPATVEPSEQCAKTGEDEYVMASPAARKLAKDMGKDIAGLYQKLGRPVKKADVAACANTQAEEAEYETVTPTSMRRVIARRTVSYTHLEPV